MAYPSLIVWPGGLHARGASEPLYPGEDIHMTMSIGRVGHDFEFRSATAYQISGKQYRFSGTVSAGSEALAKIARDQFTGLLDPQELTVPVVCAWDETLTGFYRVTNVSTVPDPNLFTRGHFEWTVDAERVGSGSNCRAESFVFGANRSSSYSGVTAQWWSATSADARGYNSRHVAFTTRSGPDATVNFYQSTQYALAAAYAWQVEPAAYYNDAPVITVNGFRVVGENTWDYNTDWSVSNGLVKVEPGVGGLLGVTGPGADASVWGATKHFQLGWYDGSVFQSGITVEQVRVFRNTPSDVVLRLACSATPSANRPTYVNVDMELKRGDRLVRLSLSSGAAEKWGIRTVGSIATTASTGMITETSNDANGNQLIVAFATNVITTTAGPSSVWTSTATTTFDAGVGVVYRGSSATSPETATDLRAQWLALVFESQTVVNF